MFCNACHPLCVMKNQSRIRPTRAKVASCVMKFITIIPLTFWIVLACMSLAWYSFGIGGLIVTVIFLALIMIH